MSNGHNRPIHNDRIGLLKQRLQDTITGSTIRNFANKSGLSVSTVFGIMKGSLPGMKNLLKISDASGKPVSYFFGEEEQTPPIADKPPLNTYRTPILSISASAGEGTLVTEENISGSMDLDQKWITQNGLNAENLVGFYAKGDSMKPTIKDGAFMLVDTTDKSPIGSDIYVIKINDHFFAKRLHMHHSGIIDIMSDNPSYPKETIPAENKDSLFIVGCVVGVLQKP